MDDVILAVEGISARYGGVRAVDDVSFGVRPGETMGIIGPNGSGKTTLLNCLNGFKTPSAGSVVLDGRTITRLTPDKRSRIGIARVFQHPQVIPELSVLANVNLGLLVRRRSRSRERSNMRLSETRARGLLEAFGLQDYINARAGSLPFGALRILELCRAVAQRPTVLLLDEPAAGMAQSDREVLASSIRTLAQEGIAVILIEHDVKFVFAVCEQVLALNFGKVISSGTPREVATEPAVRTAFLGWTKDDGEEMYRV